MRKLFFALPLTLLFACSGNQEKAKETTEKPAVATEAVIEKKYACPMQCEGEKTYAQAGKCPVCKMDLQEVALGETDSTVHNH